MSAWRTQAVVVNDTLLRAWPLPQPAPDGDKEERGRAALVAGSSQLPGAAWLSAIAALRAGGGKVAIATAANAAVPLGLRLPEARVLGLRESADGALLRDKDDGVAELLEHADAVLLGPGLRGEAETLTLVRTLLAGRPHGNQCPVILDALAMSVVGTPLARPVLLTPHAGEMAHLTGLSKADVCADMQGTVSAAAARWKAVVVLKGAVTWIATPDGRLWRHDLGNAGLAVSGSGDVLAGIVLGLAARGTPLEQAAVWGVAVHALAGCALAARIGRIGYLASELPAEVPAVLDRLDA